MENEYLSETVGLPLTQCLAELVQKQPNDPIEWIAHWLYRYMDNEIYFYEKSIYLEDLHRMRLELERERQLRQRNISKLTAQIKAIKIEVGEKVDAMGALLDNLALSRSKKSMLFKRAQMMSQDGRTVRYGPDGRPILADEMSTFGGIGPDGLPIGYGAIGPDGLPIGYGAIGPDGLPIGYGAIGPDGLPIGYGAIGPDGLPMDYGAVGPDGLPIGFGAIGPNGLPSGYGRIGPDGQPIGIGATDGFRGYGPDGLPVVNEGYDSEGRPIRPDGLPFPLGVLGPDGIPISHGAVGPGGRPTAFRGIGPDGRPAGFRGIGPDGRPIGMGAIGPDGRPIGMGAIGPDGRPIGMGAIGPDGRPIGMGVIRPDGRPTIGAIGLDGRLTMGAIGPDGRPIGMGAIGPDGRPIGMGLIGPDGRPIGMGAIGPDGRPMGFEGTSTKKSAKTARKTSSEIRIEMAELKRLGLVSSDTDVKSSKEIEALRKLKELLDMGISLTKEEQEFFLNNPDKLEEFKRMAQSAGMASWSLDCNIGLICNHSILGQLRGKAPFVPPETPSWWQRQGFIDQNLYDHELYTGAMPKRMIKDTD